MTKLSRPVFDKHLMSNIWGLLFFLQSLPHFITLTFCKNLLNLCYVTVIIINDCLQKLSLTPVLKASHISFEGYQKEKDNIKWKLNPLLSWRSVQWVEKLICRSNNIAIIFNLNPFKFIKIWKSYPNKLFLWNWLNHLTQIVKPHLSSQWSLAVRFERGFFWISCQVIDIISSLSCWQLIQKKPRTKLHWQSLSPEFSWNKNHCALPSAYSQCDNFFLEIIPDWYSDLIHNLSQLSQSIW